MSAEATARGAAVAAAEAAASVANDAQDAGELGTELLVLGGAFLMLAGLAVWWRRRAALALPPPPPPLQQQQGRLGALANKAAPGSGAGKGAGAAGGAAAPVRGPPMTVLYGSQSGTAETFSAQLVKEARAYGFNAREVDLEVYDHEYELAQEKFVVFLVATFGEGEPTDSAVAFHKWMMNEERGADELSGVTYAVFGLGNRQYEHFCEMGRRTSRRMAEMGAEELLPHGEGDDDGSLEDDYADWKTKFWAVARQRYGLASGDLEEKFQPSFSIAWEDGAKASAAADEKSADENAGEQPPVSPASAGRGGANGDEDWEEVTAEGKEQRAGGLDEETLQAARLRATRPAVVIDPKHSGNYALVLRNVELRQDTNGGSTRHIELDVAGLGLRYRTADNLGVLPRNDYKLAAKVAERLKVSPKARFRMVSKDRKPFPHLPPTPISVHDALLWYYDLTSVPKRNLLVALAGYATDPADKAKLLNWVHEGKATYLEDQKNLLEVLNDVPSVQPPFGDFLEFAPRLVPRFYTISSSSRVNPDVIHITVSLTRTDKPRGRVHEGVCSTYLRALRPLRDRVAVFVRQSTFRMPWELRPASLATAGAAPLPPPPPPPYIMVGPGTGVAPFRAFLQEAAFLKKQGVAVGEATLFFGCQRENCDYIYKDELREHEQSGVLHRLVVALSRQGPKKVYVQHRMKEPELAASIWRVLHDQRGYFYLCGGTAMGRDVRQSLLEICMEHGKLSEDDAHAFIKKLQDSGSFISELWS